MCSGNIDFKSHQGSCFQGIATAHFSIQPLAVREKSSNFPATEADAVSMIVSVEEIKTRDCYL